MKTTKTPSNTVGRIDIGLKTVPLNYKAATRTFCQCFLTAALKKYSWNVTKCAKELRISRRTLQLRMRQLGIQQESAELSSTRVESGHDADRNKSPFKDNKSDSDITSGRILNAHEAEEGVDVN